jgi:hypothetical protein
MATVLTFTMRLYYPSKAPTPFLSASKIADPVGRTTLITYWVMDPLTPEDSLLMARTAETRERTKKQEEINILAHNTSTAEDATFGGVSYDFERQRWVAGQACDRK